MEVQRVPVLPELLALQQRAEMILDRHRERMVADLPAEERPAMLRLLAQIDEAVVQRMADRVLYGR